jgi:DNA-binding GntR family transcriptional regulator
MNQIETIEKLNIERNLQNRVYEIIKNYLIRPDVPPGTHLYEDRLAKEIGVSRTPVKLALNLLEKEGIVVIQLNKGAFKVHLQFQDVIEILKIRMTLESLSLEMGKELFRDSNTFQTIQKSIPDIRSIETSEGMAKYPEMDQQFHENLIRVSNSRWLLRMIKDLDPVFQMFRFLCLQNIERIKLSVEEHKKILEALMTGDIPLGKNLIRAHWESAIQDLGKKHRETPGLFL